MTGIQHDATIDKERKGGETDNGRRFGGSVIRRFYQIACRYNRFAMLPGGNIRCFVNDDTDVTHL